jgi:predicted homoserine dehydrogenase-like protein
MMSAVESPPTRVGFVGAGRMGRPMVDRMGESQLGDDLVVAPAGDVSLLDRKTQSGKLVHRGMTLTVWLVMVFLRGR